MRVALAVAATGLLLVSPRLTSEQAPGALPASLLGFAGPRQAEQRRAEARFMASVSREQISTIHRLATSRPHMAGTAAGLEVADQLRAALNRAGLQTEVHDYRVYLSTPREIAVEIVTPARESLVVREPASRLDADTAHAQLGPAFVAYSASGSVTAPAVYVNYGLPPDYVRVREAGIDVRGKIVIARYARSHRAVKIHTAEQQGAAGILIYSDPADDGFARGLTWPDGPWRADFQTQSGNGKYSWFWHGDPLTPGVGATPDAAALDPKTAPTLPRIPAAVLPWKEASKILSKITGPPAAAGFQGGLPFTYRLGPGPVTLRLDVRMDAGHRTIRNVIARIRGRDSTREVMLGTHHDAWTFGGMDPGSGLSAVFEAARALAALTREGWRPQRDLAFAFWDAEEFGLIGSTEFAEAFQQSLRERVVTYINTDLFMRGRFDGGGTPSLREFLVQVAKDVPSFTGGGSVYDQWRADQWRRQSADRRLRGPAGFEVELAALGSGADFVAFQDFLGLPTLQMEFDFDGSYGPYHSNYDTRWYVEHFADPGFAVAETLTRVLGLALMRLGDTDVLPFRYSHYAALIRGFLDTAAMWTTDDDGREKMTLDLAEPRRLAEQIHGLASELETRIDSRLVVGPLAVAETKALNDGLARLEQTLLDEREPAAKRWYRHVIYGWNIYALYEGQPLPGLAEAVRLGDSGRAAEEVNRISNALRRMRDALTALAR